MDKTDKKEHKVVKNKNKGDIDAASSDSDGDVWHQDIYKHIKHQIKHCCKPVVKEEDPYAAKELPPQQNYRGSIHKQIVPMTEPRAKPKHRSRSRPKKEEEEHTHITFKDDCPTLTDYQKHKRNLKKQIKMLEDKKKGGLSFSNEEEEPPTFHEGKGEKLHSDHATQHIGIQKCKCDHSLDKVKVEKDDTKKFEDDELERMSKGMAAEMIEKFDKNGDGKINKREAVPMLKDAL